LKPIKVKKRPVLRTIQNAADEHKFNQLQAKLPQIIKRPMPPHLSIP